MTLVYQTFVKYFAFTMPFPLIKLFGIFVKQLSKPLAGYIKRKAKETYWVRTYVCIPPAQWYHRMDVRLRMWASGNKRSKDFKVTPLTEPVAIDIGADMLGETFIFTVGVGVLAVEYWRQTYNTAKKEKKQDDSLVQLRADINSLTEIINKQRDHIDRLTVTLESFQSKDFKIVQADRKEDIKRLKIK